MRKWMLLLELHSAIQPARDMPRYTRQQIWAIVSTSWRGILNFCLASLLAIPKVATTAVHPD